MMLNERIKDCERRRADLKLMIEAENRRPYPDEIALRSLKKRRCLLKDRLVLLQRQGVASVAA